MNRNLNNWMKWENQDFKKIPKYICTFLSLSNKQNQAAIKKVQVQNKSKTVFSHTMYC